MESLSAIPQAQQITFLDALKMPEATEGGCDKLYACARRMKTSAHICAGLKESEDTPFVAAMKIEHPLPYSW